VLKLFDLSFSYGSVQALRGVTMTMPPGQVTCVIGRNGVGKTTLMKTIMGLLTPSSGQIWLGERTIEHLPANRRAKLGVALVPQGRQIFPKLTVEENLEVGLQARSDGGRKVPEEIYDLFPVLKTMSRRMGGDLSGGQQQQLAIGRALVGEPRVLLLDEPTVGIQPNIIQQIGDVLHRLIETRNMTIVLVEQYLDFVKEFGRSFYVMNRGRVVAEGASSQQGSKLVSQHQGVCTKPGTKDNKGMIKTLAHAGPHDLSGGKGLVHVLTSPDHLLAAGAVIAACYVAYGIYRIVLRRAKAKTARNSVPYS
jgi:urea transport system ATP-binding protein